MALALLLSQHLFMAALAAESWVAVKVQGAVVVAAVEVVVALTAPRPPQGAAGPGLHPVVAGQPWRPQPLCPPVWAQLFVLTPRRWLPR